MPSEEVSGSKVCVDVLFSPFLPQVFIKHLHIPGFVLGAENTRGKDEVSFLIELISYWEK